MRSQRPLLVTATLLLLACFGCESDQKSTETPSSGGQTARSSAAGGGHATTPSGTSSQDPAKGSGGSSSSGQRSSAANNAPGGTPDATSSTTLAPGGRNSGSGGDATSTGTGRKSTAGGDANSSGSMRSIGTGGKSAVAIGGTTNSAVSSSAPKGGTATTSAGPANGGTTPTTGPCTTYGKHAEAGSMGITTSDKSQISGIVASRDHSGILYAQADSDQSVIHVMDTTGKLLGSMRLNVTPEDWEDLSIGVNSTGVDYVYVADIGDNPARTGSGTPRTSIAVYRFPEPDPSGFSTTTPLAISTLEKAEFTYPDSVHDAETLMVDPKSHDLLILTKDEDGKTIVYRAPDTAFRSNAPSKLEEVTQIPTGIAGQLNSQVSAGDISPKGDAVMLRTYGSILLFPRLATWAETFAATAITLDSPTEQQSEGLTFTGDGKGWISAGETSTTLYTAQATCP